jgi:carbon monoxide dehydrogenase subunit G
MEMQGSRHLAVTQQQAWEALNDPEVLKTCIPGCEKVEPTGENQYAIGMSVKVGPVAARFNGKIQLQDVLPPNSYTLNFEGQGGPAGFGKGQARVKLAPPAEGAGCELAYTATAQVGGKIAQVGQRLVDGVARSMAEDFFRRFDEEMNRRFPQAVMADAAVAAQQPAPTPSKRMPLWVWGVFAAVVILALLLLVQ